MPDPIDLNRRRVQRAFHHTEDDAAFQTAARVVIGLTVARNTTLRSQLEPVKYATMCRVSQTLSAHDS
jgi:hypothetical protein